MIKRTIRASGQLEIECSGPITFFASLFFTEREHHLRGYYVRHISRVLFDS